VFLALPGRRVACDAFIFDKDGTLLDLMATNLALARARAAALAALAGEAAVAAWQKAMGCDLAHDSFDRDGPLSLAPRRDEIVLTAGALYHLGHPWDEAHKLALAAYDRADETMAPPFGCQLLPGVAEMLAGLRAHGLPLAIATSDCRWRAEAALAALGVGHCFAVIVGSEDVANGKPAPDMVHAVCAQLGCSPTGAVVVGDSPVDLKMARAAGAVAVGVTTGLNEAARLQPLADLVLPSATALIDHLLPSSHA
jgi:phosphoglycolate phosphatase